MSFDPSTFLNATVTESNDTVTVPVPVGEYLAVAEKVDVNTWQKKDGSDSGLKIDIVWDIDDAGVKEFLGRPKVTSKQSIMLDLTDTGQLDLGKGKNIGLGRLREAIDLNTPGEPFAIGMIQGRMAKVKVSHRIHEGNPFDEIKAVAKPA